MTMWQSLPIEMPCVSSATPFNCARTDACVEGQKLGDNLGLSFRIVIWGNLLIVRHWSGPEMGVFMTHLAISILRQIMRPCYQDMQDEGGKVNSAKFRKHGSFTSPMYWKNRRSGWYLAQMRQFKFNLWTTVQRRNLTSLYRIIQGSKLAVI